MRLEDTIRDIAHDEINRCISDRFTERAVHIAVANYMRKHIDKVVRHEVKREEIQEMVKAALKDTKQDSLPSNHCSCWTEYEDSLFKLRFNEFCEERAAVHKRTVRAIKHRIIDKDLLNS